MNLSDRDRRALLILGVAIIGILLFYWLAPEPGAAPAVSLTDPAIGEKRLQRSRDRIAQRAELEARLAKWKQAVEVRERRLIRAETPARAQEIVLSTVRNLASQQTPPIELTTVDPGKLEPYGDRYGEATVAVSFRSSIEGLLNLMAELSQQQELLATKDLRITGLADQTKQLVVRLTVSGLVSGDLVPKKETGPRL